MAEVYRTVFDLSRIECLNDREVDRNTPLEDNWIDLILPGQTAIEHIVALTGGTTWYLTEPNQAEGITSEILDEINRRYFLGVLSGGFGCGWSATPG